MKHSAANYCTTTPVDHAQGELVAEKARKRQRADSSDSTQLNENDPMHPPSHESMPEGLGGVRRGSSFPLVSNWPDNDESIGELRPIGELQPTASQEPMVKQRSLLSSLIAADDHAGTPGLRSPSIPTLDTQRPIEPVSQNFFKLEGGMPVPKRGFSLTADAMLELARECEDANSSSLSLEVFFRADPKEEPDHLDSVDFVGDVWAT